MDGVERAGKGLHSYFSLVCSISLILNGRVFSNLRVSVENLSYIVFLIKSYVLNIKMDEVNFLCFK